ncbi:MAG TPA: phosphate signaling complex protein PhoU [Gemmatimonadaceae bacterium]|jgi:phosphate transport system protein|nr:phosphate signaling complex protein PhoU [Gemmatimonadaceae bacterium]
MTGETHRHFHDQLAEVRQWLLTMSGAAESALELAVESLLNRDPERAAHVLAGDQDINRREVEIEERCIALIALQQPMAKDLRMLLAMLNIASSLERIGDHAVNIAEAATRLAGSRRDLPELEIAKTARLARAMLSDAIDAFIRDDASSARAICLRDDEVDELNRSVFRAVLARMVQDPEVIGVGMELVLVSRNLERVADLATNIAEEVVYLVEAKTIKHHAEDGLTS